MGNKLSPVDPKKFDALYGINEALSGVDWRALFSTVIQAQEELSFTPSFWYIGDFRVGHIIASGGKVAHCTPLKQDGLIGQSPNDIGHLIHPDDRQKMMTYVVYIAGFLASKSDESRPNYRPSLIFRMKNVFNQYTWRIMHYPKMIYHERNPILVMCAVEDYHQIVNGKCCMYLLDKEGGSPTMYYCEEEQVEWKEVSNLPSFSPRELEVVELLKRGKISKEIASELGISKNTVENHKQKMFEKCGVRKVTELIHFVVEHQLLPV